MRGLALCGVLVAVTAFAATRAYESGVAPASNTASPLTIGVDMANAVGCRCSLHIDAGLVDDVGRRGLLAQGYIATEYYDKSTVKWVESPRSLALACPIQSKLDAGLILEALCPDAQPLASFGRLHCYGIGIVGEDAGSGADQLSDAGPGPQPVVRTECWGPGFVP